MDNADKYIIVDNANNPVTSKIYVYNGIVDEFADNYALTGYQINVGNDKIVIVYAMGDMGVGFGANAYEVGYVLYEKANGKVLNAAYDDAQLGDWYLLGSSAYEVTVMNLLTGTQNTVMATSNVDLVNGHIYKTIGGVVIADETDECNGDLHNFIEKIDAAYHSVDLSYADYRVAPITITADTATDADIALALGLVGEDGDKVANLDAIDLKIADAKIGTKAYFVTDDDQANVNFYGHGTISVEKLEKLAANTTYEGWVVYDVNTTNVVFYVRVEDVTVEGTTDKVIDGAKGDEGTVIYKWDYTDDIKVEATLEADWAGVYNTETRDGKTTNVSATIDEIALYFDVEKLDDHDDIAMAGYAFGILDDHGESYFGYNDSFIKVVDQTAKNFYYAAQWNMDTYECKTCDMVNYVSVSGLDITLDDEHNDAWVRFDVNGDYQVNGMTEGNDIEVVIHLVWNNGEVVVEKTTENNFNGGATLKSIDLDLIH